MEKVSLDTTKSVTPHQDAAREALRVMRESMPTDATPHLRIVLALVEAATTAVAKERDSGQSVSIIMHGMMMGIGSMAASFIRSAAFDMPQAFQLEGLQHLLAGARKHALETMDGQTDVAVGVVYNDCSKRAD